MARAALDILEQAGVNPADSNRGFMKALYAYDAPEDDGDLCVPTESFLSKAADSGQWFAKSKAKTLLPKVYPFLETPLNDFCALWGKDMRFIILPAFWTGRYMDLGWPENCTRLSGN